MQNDFDRVNYEEKQVGQFRERINKAREQVDMEVELEQLGRTWRLNMAISKRLNRVAEPLGAGTVASLIAPGRSTAAAEEEICALGNETERLRMQTEAKRRDHGERVTKLQRSVCSLPACPATVAFSTALHPATWLRFLSDVAETIYFSSIGRSSESRSIGIGKDALYSNQRTVFRTRSFPVISVSSPPSRPNTLTSASLQPIQSGIIVLLTFDKPYRNRETRFQPSNRYREPSRAEFAPVPQSQDEFQQHIQVALLRGLAVLLLFRSYNSAGNQFSPLSKSEKKG